LSTPSNIQDKKGLIQNLKSFFSQVFFLKEKLLVKLLKLSKRKVVVSDHHITPPVETSLTCIFPFYAQMLPI